MTNVGIPIVNYASYIATEKQYRDLTNLTASDCDEVSGEGRCPERTPIYREITFSDITATTAAGSRAGLIWGLPEAPATGIALENLRITADKPFGFYDAKGVRVEGCRFIVPGGGNGLETGNAEVEVKG